jgi:hypothetical protein
LIDHRISADAGLRYEPDAWRHILADAPGVAKSKAEGTRYVNLLDYMLELTQSRPRDILKFLQLAASTAMAHEKSKIDSEVISECEFQYSTYLKQEFEDEIHLVVPEPRPR